MENRAHALAAGLFVVVLLLCVAAAAIWFSGRHENTRDYLIVTQRSVTGLNPQAQVRYRGIRAGKVEDIDLDPKNPRDILIRIRIDDDIPITRGTTAQLNHQGVTGLAYVMLEDDGRDAELLQAGEGELPRLTLGPSMMDSLAEAAARIGRLFDEASLKDVRRSLGNVAEATEVLKELPLILAQVKKALNDDNLRRLSALLSHLERTAGEAAPLTAEVRGLVASMQSLSRRFDQLGQTASDGTLPRMNELLGELQQNSRQLHRVLENLEDSPQSVIFGRAVASPGPGETGFVAGK